MSLNRLLRDPLGGEPAGCDLGGDEPNGIRYLGAAAVVDTHGEGHRAIARGQALGVLKLVDNTGPEARPSTGPSDSHAPLIQLVAAAAQHLAVESHQKAHLVGAALPVLGRERIDAEVLHSDRDRAGNDVKQRSLARAVALDAGQPLQVGPASIAVHNDRHVFRNSVERHRGRKPPGIGKRQELNRSGLLSPVTAAHATAPLA